MARDNAKAFIQTLDGIVDTDELTLTDICIFPFIRQFRAVDKVWFDALPYKNTHAWLQWCMESDLFLTIFDKKFKTFGLSKAS